MPRVSSKASKTEKSADALAALGANLVDDEAADPGIDAAPRVTIMLEENENIAPGGQFFQVGGSDAQGNRFVHSYLLRPGEKASVPADLIEVLNNAVESMPIKDASDTVVGYRDKLRFPYRVIAESGKRA